MSSESYSLTAADGGALDCNFDIVEKLLLVLSVAERIEGVLAKRLNAGARTVLVCKRRVWDDAARRLRLIADMILL